MQMSSSWKILNTDLAGFDLWVFFVGEGEEIFKF